MVFNVAPFITKNGGTPPLLYYVILPRLAVMFGFYTV